MAGLQEAFERIGEAAEAHLPRTHAAGLSLAVTDGDETLGAVVRGFADVAAGRPVRPDTRFQIGSISKSFAALCVLQEEAKGTLGLDVSIDELLPWLELPEPLGPITLHHLMTHTSGLMTGVEQGPWGMIDSIRARAFPPTTAPGERFWYSNLGYKLVGFALERVSGQPVHELLVDRILGPLGMSRSMGAVVEDDRADASVGYEPILSDRPAHLQSPLGPAVWQPSNTADGSIVSTAPDLCAYARMVLANGAPLIEPSAFVRWIGPHVDSDERGTRYGYGWDVLERDGRRVIRHTGGTVGFTALLEIWPHDAIAVAICQNGPGSKDALGAFALAAVGSAIRGEELPEVPDVPSPDIVPEAASLAGTYRAQEQVLRLDAEDGRLVLRTGPLAVALERMPEQTGVFLAPHPALERHAVRVQRNGDGVVVGLTHGPVWLAREDATAPEAANHPDGWAAFPGLYRADTPWLRAQRVYLRLGRLFLFEPASCEELELTPLEGEWFAVGDPALPRRVRFLDLIEGRAQTLEYDGALLTRSFEA